jgi:hypothetical protein
MAIQKSMKSRTLVEDFKDGMVIIAFIDFLQDDTCLPHFKS